jgi:hypothetical protein
MRQLDALNPCVHAPAAHTSFVHDSPSLAHAAPA